MPDKKREGFASRLGFILVSAGCAVGIGNVWKFPYVAGSNGGAFFVLVYLFFLALIGVPVLSMELSVGRAGKSTSIVAIKNLEHKGTKWHITGWAGLLGCYLLMFYYTTVSGWMLTYFWKYISGSLYGVSEEQVPDVFNSLLADPLTMTIFMVIIVIAGFVVIAFGVQKGLERVNKVMMAGLFLIIIGLTVNSLLLKDAGKGIEFYLVPNRNIIKDIGIVKIVSNAMSQAFFTLSIGIGAMEVFGSYMSSETSIAGDAVRICVLDTFVAIMAGLIIFPACSSFGVDTAEGPSLIFVTLPCIFSDMKGGMIWGALFFLFMTFASFSTIIAVFENLVTNITDVFGFSRRRSIIINLVIVLVFSMPCVLGFNLLSTDVLGFEDYIVSKILLPLGSLAYVLFCSFKKGWGFDSYLKECNTGEGAKIKHSYATFYRYVLPLMILFIFVMGLLPS